MLEGLFLITWLKSKKGVFETVINRAIKVRLYPNKEQQYFIDFLDRIDARNPAIALLERPNTYLVDGQTKELLWYMREHYGEDIQLHYVGRANKRKVYQLIRSEKPLEGEENLEENADSRDRETLEDEPDNKKGTCVSEGK